MVDNRAWGRVGVGVLVGSSGVLVDVLVGGSRSVVCGRWLRCIGGRLRCIGRRHQVCW